MAEYQGTVVYRAYQDVCVEADSEDEARQLMQEQFDLHRANAEMEVYDLKEIK